MRTTVTLDSDTEALVRRMMAERGVSFKRALNDAIRAGAHPRTRAEFRTHTRTMGAPSIDLDRALDFAAGEEDEELLRRLRVGS